MASYIKIGPKSNALLYNNNSAHKIVFQLFDDDNGEPSKNVTKNSKNQDNMTKSNLEKLDFTAKESSSNTVS